MPSEKITLKPRNSRNIRIELTPKPAVKVTFTKHVELRKHQHNIRCILECSNATPIGRYGGLGYMCCYCERSFAQPEMLKEHSLQMHNTSAVTSKFAETQQLCNFIVKLDITELQCTLCNIPQATLEDLIPHLTSIHDKHYYTDIKSHIVPFKFDKKFYCILCQIKFTNFKILLMHMNEHFRNFVCETCGQGFVNSKILQSHLYRHNKGEFKCEFCDKVFDTNVKCKDHERAKHKMNNMRSKCGYCGERFNDYVKRNLHLAKEHGVKLVLLKCTACSKTFDNRRSLTIHTKSYHSIEKRPRKGSSE